MKCIMQLMAGLLLGAALTATLNASAEVTVEPELLEEKVVQYIKNTTPLEDPKASLWVQVMKSPEPMTLDGTRYTVLMHDSRSIPLTFRTIVQVTIETESETRVIGVPVKLAVLKPVWVTKRLINAREAIASKNVVLENRRLEYDEAYALGAGDDPSLYTSRMTLVPGTMLDMRKLTLTPTISRNSQVHVIAKMANGIQISFYGKAMEDGILGRNIRIQQVLENRKRRVYTGQVVDKNTVSVDL